MFRFIHFFGMTIPSGLACIWRHPPYAFLFLLLCGGLGLQAQVNPFPSTFKLSSLDGTTGFRINGIEPSGDFGRAASGIGDLNGDGLADFIVGAPTMSRDGDNRVGACFVVFGRSTGFPANLDVSALDGSDGFKLLGVGAFAETGGAVSYAGDVNGDGIDDLIIGASSASSGGLQGTGAAYVVFGRDTGFDATLDLGTLNGTTGFTMYGPGAGDQIGSDVAWAGDVNHDGIDDLLVSSFSDSPGGLTNAGIVYVVMGRDTGFGATVDLAALNGQNGFVIPGLSAGDYTGLAVSGTGDLNGDGIDDFAIGAPRAQPGGRVNAGKVYVVFGRDTDFPASFDLAGLNGSNGFVMEGNGPNDFIGEQLDRAGDVNQDGRPALLMGTPRGTIGGNVSDGMAHVVYARDTPFPASWELFNLDGINGFAMPSPQGGALMGASVNGIGDLNGDGISDFVIGSPYLSFGGSNPSGGGYVVLGRSAGFPAVFDLATLGGLDGFAIEGEAPFDQTGTASCGIGDINGDGYDDFLIGAPGGGASHGRAYVIFGRDAVVSTDDPALDLFSLYPNPSAGRVRLQARLVDPQSARVTVVNIQGQTVWQLGAEQQIAGQLDLTIDLSHLPQGPYFLILAHGDKVSTRMFVLQR